jgi:hypothetical protein
MAEAALESLRPVLEVTEEEHNLLRHRLTVLPAAPTLLASLAVVAFVLLLGAVTGQGESSIDALASSPMTQRILILVYYVGWWAFGAFVYHTIRQLRVIHCIYTEHTHVSLFAMGPLYAFSSVTATTALTLAIATYGWTLLNPDNLSNPVSILLFLLITVLALAAFSWPLLGTRRLLAEEKTRRLDAVSLRLEAVFTELHQRIDAGRVGEVDDLSRALAILQEERNMLLAISTWPWQPETLRLLVTALILPMLLWITQYVLQILLSS